MTNVLVTERLTLRPLELGDAEGIEELAGDKRVADTTLNIPHPYPTGSATPFIQARQEAAARGDGYSFAVISGQSGVRRGDDAEPRFVQGYGEDRYAAGGHPAPSY